MRKGLRVRGGGFYVGAGSFTSSSTSWVSSMSFCPCGSRGMRLGFALGRRGWLSWRRRPCILLWCLRRKGRGFVCRVCVVCFRVACRFVVAWVEGLGLFFPC